MSSEISAEPPTDPTQEVSPQAVPRTPLPDVFDLIFVLILMLLINLLPNFVLGDGSTGWHLATGNYILSNGQIPSHDLFSYTYPDKSWVPYEWFADVVGAGLDRLGGLRLVALATSCAIALLFSLLYKECRKEGCHFLFALVISILGILTSTIHWLARPHIFTFFGVFLFSRHLEKFRTGHESAKRLLITLPLVMVIWCNAHPAFLVGFALIAIYLACEIFLALTSEVGDYRSACWNRVKVFASALALTALSTLVNPNALKMYSYIFGYLGHSYVLQNTNEFMPPSFHQLHAICMAILFFIFVVGLFLSRKRLGLAPLMMVMAFAWLAINSMRNEPLFIIVSLPLIARLYSSIDLGHLFEGHSSGLSPWFTKMKAAWMRVGEPVDEVEASANMHILPIATTLILMASCFMGGKLLGMDLVTSEFDPLTKPTSTLDCLKKHNLPDKGGFSLDNWGGYINYKTGRRVFIDDRLDFYGPEVMTEYGETIGSSTKWREVFAKHHIDWVLFPTKSILVQALKSSGEWQVLCEDKASTLLKRKL